MRSRLVASLVSRLGSEQTRQELRWMKQANDDGSGLNKMLRRRARGEPLQYILGTQPFGPLNLLVYPPVLIPRPETEHWVIRLADELSPTAQNPVSLLDLGTGSGCIPLLLCHLWPPGSTHAHAIDISPHALRLTQQNASLCGISPHFDHEKKPQNTLNVFNANFLAESFSETVLRINPPFNLITSNPPYIPWKEYLQLPRSVLDFEDPRALFGGPSGLDFYHAIARLVSRDHILAPDGIIALEVGCNQAETVERLLRETRRFRQTDIWLDPWGKQRTVIGYAWH